MQISAEQRRQAFSIWVRTGRLTPVTDDAGLELKFNPWHDPKNGRFTFAGQGRRYSRGDQRRSKPRAQDAPTIVLQESSRLPPITSAEDVEALTAKLLAEHGSNAANRSLIEANRRRMLAVLASNRVEPNSQVSSQNIATDFAKGVADGAYDVASSTVTGIYSLLTTNPLKSIRNIEFGIAGTIDSVLEAEDTPAHLQFSRAVSAVTQASAHGIGYAAGTMLANAALVVGPQRLASKLTAVRQIRKGASAPVKAVSPNVIWVSETNNAKGFAKDYNDTAMGAHYDLVTRRNRVPALERTMEDGSRRLVKFDGIDGNVLIDRKSKVVTAQHGREQAIRQSAVLKQHGLTGRWEVPNERQRRVALKLFEKHGIKNIDVRVVKHGTD